MIRLIISFQCVKVVISQADCIISHPVLKLEYSSKSVTFDGFDDKQKID